MFDSAGRFCSPRTMLRYHEKRNLDAYLFLTENSELGYSASESIYRLLNEVTVTPSCEFCDAACPYRNFTSGYNSTCGKSECLKQAYGKNPAIQTQEMRDATSIRMRLNNPMFNPVIANKVFETQRKIGLGVVPMHLEKNKLLALNSRYDRYGTFSPKSNLFKCKDYELPSGKIISVQGYEPLALDILYRKYIESEIIICGKMHMFYYEFEESRKRYYPDIFIPKENLYIDVKSEYTLNIDYNKNICKQNSVISSGFKFEFWKLDPNGSLEILNL